MLGTNTFSRAQQLLRIAYAHAQAMLYRPFLHFVATDKRSHNIDQRAYTCAASYVNLSRNHIHLCVQMKQKGLLNGAHWFVMYTTFFAVVSLIYFAAENPQNITTEAVLKDAIQGKEVLASLAKRSMAADRCATTLEVRFPRVHLLPYTYRLAGNLQGIASLGARRPYEPCPLP